METIKISGMSCQHCVGSVKTALEGLGGLKQVTVNLEAGEASFENSGIEREKIRAAITQIGFDPGE